MATNDQVRQRVSQTYARAVSSTGEQRSCCGGEAPKGVVALLAGYTADELRALPADAVVNSFGCGNPLAFSGVQPGDTVLDLGSGAGIDLLLAAKLVGPGGKVIGVDMTDEMIEAAHRNAAAAGVAGVVEVRKGLIENLPLESDSVDWVISNCVINLSPEKPRVFAEIARVLRPGGQMLVSDIVARDLPAWVQQSDALYDTCVAGAIDEARYLGGLRDAGLVDVEVRERLVYDEAQIAAFMLSEDGGACCCGGADEGLAREMARSVVGQIWSAKIYARKPAP
jgi:arsenite methyltransferase